MKKKLDKLDLYVIGSAVYIAAWSVAFFIAWCLMETEPNTLEGCILAPGVVEMVMCAIIKRGKQQCGESDVEEVEING